LVTIKKNARGKQTKLTGTQCKIKRKWSCCGKLIAGKDLQEHIKEDHLGDFTDPKNIPKLKKIEEKINAMQIPKKWA